MHVLLIEDDEPVSCLLHTILIRDGFTVTSFMDRTALYGKLGTMPEPDILICDVCLSGGSGIELSENILDRYPKCVPVLMSGTAGLGDEIALSRGHGPVTLLRKPFSASEFRERVWNACLDAKPGDLSRHAAA